MSTHNTDFRSEVTQNIKSLSGDIALQKASIAWLCETAKHRYSYNFSSLGRPIIQYPQDMVAMQELIWTVKPDLIVETGIAHGGSLVMSAAALALLDYCDAVESGHPLDVTKPRRKVLGVDIDIRAHNRAAIETHPMAHRIEMIQGSSVASETIAQVKDWVARAGAQTTVMVCLDSNHTHEHVLMELNAYANLTSVGSYCVVFDTVVEDMPAESFPNRPWGKGNNPKTAVWEFLKSHSEFEIDKAIDHKLLVSVAPDGYLKRVR